MFTITDDINNVEFKDLKASKLLEINAQETLLISLEKNAIFPEHTSPRDAHLLVLEGAICFNIVNKEYILNKHQVFNFPKDEVHWVKAIENSKFLILR